MTFKWIEKLKDIVDEAYKQALEEKFKKIQFILRGINIISTNYDGSFQGRIEYNTVSKSTYECTASKSIHEWDSLSFNWDEDIVNNTISFNEKFVSSTLFCGLDSRYESEIIEKLADYLNWKEDVINFLKIVRKNK